MRRATEIKQLPILSIQDGANVEKVLHLAVNPASKKVEYLALAGAQWFETPSVIPWGKLKAVGRDLITIKSKKDIAQINDDTRKALAKSVAVTGAEVIDSSGQICGRVVDFAIEEAGGELKTLFLDNGGELDAATIVTISAATVVTDAGGEEQASFSENDFLLGKTVAVDITDDQGAVIIAAGTVITAKEIEDAKNGNALYDLVTGVK